LQDDYDLESLALSVKKIGLIAPNEEKLKIEFEKLLGNYFTSDVTKVDASYEYTFISGKKADALYGHVIIEYEPPGALNVRHLRNKATEQLKDYIKHAAREHGVENQHRFFGITTDGRQIVFVRYISSKKIWDVKRPFDINTMSMGRMVEAIRALHKKPLDARLMIQDFGPHGEIAVSMIKILYNSSMKNTRSKMIYEEWKRVFQQVSSFSPKSTKGLEKIYGISEKVDYQKLLFCIHTYYALIMKLIAAEVVVLYGVGKITTSLLASLVDAETSDKLKEKLTEVDTGSLFEYPNFIKNLVEGDYFSWYLEEWDEYLHHSIYTIIRKLSEYEVGTADLEPERVKDLFKSIYQKLVPRSIRIKLGEYYTPDWLAELVLDTSHYAVKDFEQYAKQTQNKLSPLELRILDPACGTGTFLVLAIKRIKEYAEDHFIDERYLVDKITNNIIGYDLNPLAIIASRTNYLLALGDLLRELRGKEVPIFLADSIMIEERRTLEGKKVLLSTEVGEFSIASSIIQKGVFSKLLSAIDRYIEKYSVTEFIARLKLEILTLDEREILDIGALFEKFSDLEREGKNRIWTSILKNSFAPLFKGKFDYVIGNPPWISWENLNPKLWKQAWDKLTEKGLIKEVSGAAFRKDIASLFVVYCFEEYLKQSGTLGFLIPFTLFKTQSGGSFRRFLKNATDVIQHFFMLSSRAVWKMLLETKMLFSSHR
jgi:type I restriction-modification system DNA methylase subunit